MILSGPLLWNVVVFAVHWMLFLYRMVARRAGAAARIRITGPIAQKTRYRLIPGVY